MAINKIMCCCGSGLGSSMLVRMNVEKILKNHDITDVEVVHTSVTDAHAESADLFVVGKDLEDVVKDVENKIIVTNIMDQQELETKLSQVFGW